MDRQGLRRSLLAAITIGEDLPEEVVIACGSDTLAYYLLDVLRAVSEDRATSWTDVSVLMDEIVTIVLPMLEGE